MSLPLFIINAFVRENQPFSGNPAAVCLLGSTKPSEASMQALAAQMQLSETAFAGVGDARGSFNLRWFTPAAEVALCGHATLATAHALWTSGVLELGEEARFDTLSGRLTASQSGDGRLSMDFPATAPAPCEPPNGLFEALGITKASYVGRSRFDILIEIEGGVSALDHIKPDFASLKQVDVRGVIVTCAADKDSTADIASRFFAPAVGVPEDPVTGSAHCALAPFWAARLGTEILRAEQRSKRGGELEMETRGERVILTGRAHTALEGTLAPSLLG